MAGSKSVLNFAVSKTTKTLGRLAQLVQSICLTSRGSGVRIPQRPPQSIEQKFGALFVYTYTSVQYPTSQQNI